MEVSVSVAVGQGTCREHVEGVVEVALWQHNGGWTVVEGGCMHESSVDSGK